MYVFALSVVCLALVAVVVADDADDVQMRRKQGQGWASTLRTHVTCPFNYRRCSVILLNVNERNSDVKSFKRNSSVSVTAAQLSWPVHYPFSCFDSFANWFLSHNCLNYAHYDFSVSMLASSSPNSIHGEFLMKLVFSLKIARYVFSQTCRLVLSGPGVCCPVKAATH